MFKILVPFLVIAKVKNLIVCRYANTRSMFNWGYQNIFLVIPVFNYPSSTVILGIDHLKCRGSILCMYKLVLDYFPSILFSISCEILFYFLDRFSFPGLPLHLHYVKRRSVFSFLSLIFPLSERKVWWYNIPYPILHEFWWWL